MPTSFFNYHPRNAVIKAARNGWTSPLRLSCARLAAWVATTRKKAACTTRVVDRDAAISLFFGYLRAIPTHPTSYEACFRRLRTAHTFPAENAETWGEFAVIRRSFSSLGWFGIFFWIPPNRAGAYVFILTANIRSTHHALPSQCLGLAVIKMRWASSCGGGN